MYKHLKTIGAMLMVVMMLVSTCIPAMAAEVINITDDTAVSVEKAMVEATLPAVETVMAEETPSMELLVDNKQNKIIYEDKYVSSGATLVHSTYIGVSATKIRVTAKGNGFLNLRVRQTLTGDFRQFSVAATPSGNTNTVAITPLSTGSYALIADTASPSGKYTITVEFLR